jgi:hypothetical protein
MQVSLQVYKFISLGLGLGLGIYFSILVVFGFMWSGALDKYDVLLP